MSEKGYSLLELSLVLSILSAALLATAPVIKNQLDALETHWLLNRISADLYLASNQARSHQSIVSLHIFRSQHFYLLNSNGKQLKKVSLPPGYRISSNFNMDRVTFYMDGGVAQAGTISVLDRKGKIHQLIVQLSSGRFWIKNG